MDVRSLACAVGYPGRGHSHTVGCELARRAAGLWAVYQCALSIAVITLCTLRRVLRLAVVFKAHADSQRFN